MNGCSGRTLVSAMAGLLALLVQRPAAADIADVYLKSGLKLRGDVTATQPQVIVRNAAGELRLSPDEVERIVPLGSAASQPASQPATRPAAAPASRPEAGRHERKPVTTRPALPPAIPAAEPEKPARPELTPPPLSAEDIQRLKMLELKLDGPADVLRVRFKKKVRQHDLPAEILEQFKRRDDFRPEWEEVLTHGQPYEKLQLIVRLTAARHADRVEIENDPETFDTFRRRVLPLVDRGCARSGCHAGKTAHVFRFPVGSTTSETYAYTTFVLLDQMQTKQGPLLDRTNPEDSVLLGYVLPQEGQERAHPPVGRGPAFNAVILHRDDRSYATVLGWINHLTVPHPEYGLDYENPYAGQPGARPAEDRERGAAGADEPATSQPAERHEAQPKTPE